MTHPVYWDPNDPISEATYRTAWGASHGGTSMGGYAPGGGLGGNGDWYDPFVELGLEAVRSALPARRPPVLPPAGGGGGVPARLPPAGVPYPIPRGGRGPMIGPQIPRISAAAKAAAIAAGAYQVGRWLYDAAGNLLGQTRRRPRMNVCNPRALKRSMRRVTGFAGVARRAISFTRRIKMKKGAFRGKGKAACR
jgi:hypothetical protein